MADELNTIQGHMTQIPATVLHLLGEAVPETIPSPIGEISNIGIERVVFVILDNFGLFEIVVHQPEFMINNLESIILLETENPYAMAVMQQIVYGDLERRDFNLFEYLRSRNKSAVMIGREDDIKLFAGGTENIKSSGDMTTWIQASKILNKRDLIWLNFQDFEALYQRSIMFKREPPENLIQRLIHRTDKWLLGMFKQSRNNTVFIILGNHGRKKIDMNLTGKYAEWRKASLPIAIICRK